MTSDGPSGTGDEPAAAPDPAAKPGSSTEGSPSAEDLVADVTDSDANGNTPHGLAGGMGVSSERVGRMSDVPQEGTHAAGPTHPDAGRDVRDTDVPVDAPPEQNPDPARGPEVRPDLPPPADATESAPNPLGPGPDHPKRTSWRTQDDDD